MASESRPPTAAGRAPLARPVPCAPGVTRTTSIVGTSRLDSSRPADRTEANARRAGRAGDLAGPAGAGRRGRAALLNAAALVATTAVFAAAEPKFPKLVGD